MSDENVNEDEVNEDEVTQEEGRDQFTLDPNIWKNPTLGEVGAGPFLPELDVQQQEDLNAKREGREPKVVQYVHRHPKPMPSGSVPSQTNELEFVEPDVAFNRQSEPPVAEETNTAVPNLPYPPENTTPVVEEFE